jgi:hypothetical protein
MSTVQGVPGIAQRRLTPAQERKLARIEAARDRLDQQWADLAQEAGYSAMARAIGLTPEAVRQRVIKIRGR